MSVEANMLAELKKINQQLHKIGQLAETINKNLVVVGNHIVKETDQDATEQE